MLQDHLMTKEARAGLSKRRSMKSILKRILRCRLGRISNGQWSFVNTVCVCIHNCKDDHQLSVSAIGHHLGVNKNFVSRAKFKSYKRVALVTSGDKKGFEFVDTDQKGSNFNDEQLTKFEQWKECWECNNGNRIAIEIRQKVVLRINGKRLPSGRVRWRYSLPCSTCTIVCRNYMHKLVVTKYRNVVGVHFVCIPQGGSQQHSRWTPRCRWA